MPDEYSNRLSYGGDYNVQIGGSTGIRTQGAVTPGSFQDCCNKPDSATLPKTSLDTIPRGSHRTAKALAVIHWELSKSRMELEISMLTPSTEDEATLHY